MRLVFIIWIVLGCSMLRAQPKHPTNKYFWSSLETTASPETIWKIWMDVPNWKNWDTGLKEASIQNKLNLNVKGKLVSLENRMTKFKIVEFIEGKSYTFKTKLPFGSLFVKRYLEFNNGTTIYTHEVWFKGLTSGLFANAFGERFRTMLPGVLQNINKISMDYDNH